MQTYEVLYTSGKPNWEQIPVVHMSPLWEEPHGITGQAQAAWNEDGLYVRLQAREEHILQRLTQPLDQVCNDSCLEFFFCPQEGNERYFNFECNPKGTLYLGYGLPNEQRCRLYRPNLQEIFRVNPFFTQDGWGVEFYFPVWAVNFFVQDYALKKGMTLRANFYKCGDETPHPHYLAWNPIDNPFPKFHLPQFFGQLILK